MRFLRVIFWGGLLIAAGLYWFSKNQDININFDKDGDEVSFSEEIEVTHEDWSELRGFDQLDLRGGYKVIIHPGADTRVEVEGPEEALNHLKAHIHGSTLKVEQEDRWKGRFKDKITLHIYANELEEIDVSGAVEMRSEHVLTGNDMNIDVSGAGSINLKVEVEKLEAEISGAGKYSLAGQSQESHYDISGAGEVQAFDLQSEIVSVEISGAGSAKVFASEKLKAKIAGAGSVVYDGNPRNVEQSIFGAGSVRKRN